VSAVAFAATLSVTSRGLTVYRTCLLTATAAGSTAVFDAWVNQNTPTATGAVTSLNVASQTGQNQRAYLRFDITKCNPAMPSSAAVKLATLRLYGGAPPAACRTHDLFTVASAWNETTITWNNQPFGATINNPVQSQRKSTMAIGTPVGCQNTAGGYGTGWDVTSDVQAFVSGTATNNGWMIRDDVEGSATARLEQYGSKNTAGVAVAPQLLVTYS
jgi:hypothetical protein